MEAVINDSLARVSGARDQRELLATLRHRQLLDFEGKVMDHQLACRLTQSWQADGLVVGFTNGCFDLIHPGHVALLENARKACDRLVVGPERSSARHRAGVDEQRRYGGYFLR